MVHKMKLVDFAFNMVKEGKKDIEVRLNDEKRKLIKEGDIIEFSCVDTNEKIKVEVIKLYKFNSFKELFNNFDNKRLGLNKEDNYTIMDKFYTKEEQGKYEALGIQIKLLNKYK